MVSNSLKKKKFRKIYFIDNFFKKKIQFPYPSNKSQPNDDDNNRLSF